MAPSDERMPGRSSPSAKSVKTYPGIASGSTSVHSIHLRPGKSQNETRAARAVPSKSVPAPTPPTSTTVATTASGKRSENSDRPPGATAKLRGSPMSGAATAAAQTTVRSAQASIPSHFIHQPHGLAEVRAGAVDVDRIALEAGAAPYRILVVVLYEHPLLGRLEEVLDQLAGLVGLVGSPHNPDPREVDVRAPTLLVGPDRRHREVRIVGKLALQVVVVREPDVAVAVGDGIEHVGVRAEDLRVVLHPAAQHALGSGPAVLGDAVG